MSFIIKTCLHCEQEFQADIREHNRGNAKFCNYSCFNSFRTRPNTVCAQCGNEFFRRYGNKKKAKHGMHFCDRACKDKAQRLGGISKIQPSHYGTGTGEYSYRVRAFREYPHECADCGFDKHTGVLEVHHIDESRDNNAIQNLVILCRNCHRLRHLDFLDETC